MTPLVRFPELQNHEPRADQHTDGSWEAAIRHWSPSNKDNLIAQYGANPPNPNLIDPIMNPVASITTLKHKFPTQEMALEHAKIWVDALKREQELLARRIK
jgi:hypothetical protein